MNPFKHLVHWLHVAEEDTIGLAVTTIHRGIMVTEDLRAQLPTLGMETAAVATDALQCKSLAAAVALAVAGGGINLAADAGVLAALVKDGAALIKLFDDAARLAKTAGVDVAKDTADLMGSNLAKN